MNKTIILLGPPGCGKGTQTEILKELGFDIIVVGDLLRQEKNSGSKLGNNIKDIIDKGNLIPDGLINSIIDESIEQVNPKKGLVLDGYPRTMGQAIHLQNNLEVDLAIFLNVSDEESVERIKKRGETSGRSDDQNEDIIKTRLEEYKKLTQPLIEFYTQQGVLSKIDGSKSIDDISEEIKSLL